MEIVIIERGAYGNKNCNRFNIVLNGVVIGGGIHHSRPYRSEWVNTETMERFANKADLIAGFEVWLSA